MNRHTFKLDSGRKVSLQECYLSRSAIGFLEGREDVIRPVIIKHLPERIRAQFPNRAYVVKRIPEGALPPYFLMVSCDSTPVGSDSNSHGSTLVICWLLDDLGGSLSEVIAQGVRAVDWDAHAENYEV